jgi:hypothetical protein
MGKPLQGSGSIAEVRKQSCRLTAIAQGSLDTTPWPYEKNGYSLKITLKRPLLTVNPPLPV